MSLTAPTPQQLPGGTYRAGDLELTRVGYGAMQLAGPGVSGPPRDHDEALAVLRTAVELGIRHIDTADFYGPFVTNELIREALAPYPDDLHIVTKVGAVRDDDGGWNLARTPDDLRAQVHDNLRHLGLDVLDVVNLRVGTPESPEPGSLAEQVETMAELVQQGLVRHVGLSNVTADQLAEAQEIVPVVCVQNLYNLAQRQDDELVGEVATRLEATPMAVALAWLLQRSPNVLLIPGTSTVAHLRENVAAAGLQLPPDELAVLDGIAG